MIIIIMMMMMMRMIKTTTITKKKLRSSSNFNGRNRLERFLLTLFYYLAALENEKRQYTQWRPGKKGKMNNFI